MSEAATDSRPVVSWHCDECGIDEQAVPGADRDPDAPACALCAAKMHPTYASAQ